MSVAMRRALVTLRGRCGREGGRTHRVSYGEHDGVEPPELGLILRGEIPECHVHGSPLLVVAVHLAATSCGSRFFGFFKWRSVQSHSAPAGPDVAPLGGGPALLRAPRGTRRGQGRATPRRALRGVAPRPSRRRPGRQETRLGDRGRDGLDAPRPFLRARRRRVATRRPRAAGAATRGVPGARGRPRREEPVQRVRRERADQDRDGGFTARERRARAVGAPRGGGVREVSRPLPAAEGDARRGGPAAATRGSIAHRTSSPGIPGSQPVDLFLSPRSHPPRRRRRNVTWRCCTTCRPGSSGPAAHSAATHGGKRNTGAPPFPPPVGGVLGRFSSRTTRLSTHDGVLRAGAQPARMTLASASELGHGS